MRYQSRDRDFEKVSNDNQPIDGRTGIIDRVANRVIEIVAGIWKGLQSPIYRKFERHEQAPNDDGTRVVDIYGSGGLHGWMESGD